jgi:hypothetical protein
VDRHKLRRLDRLPRAVLTVGLVNYVVEDKLLHAQHGGLAAVGGAFLLILVVTWVVRRISGMTWREAVWPRREPPLCRQLPLNMASVHELIDTGRKLQAIRMYHELTGASTRASVQAVDALAARRPVDGIAGKGHQAEDCRTSVD